MTSWNPAAEAIYRRPASQALGRYVSEAVGAELDPSKIIAEGGSVSATHHARDGATRAVRVSAAAMDEGYVLLCTDQTALRRAEQHFQTVVRSLDEGVVVLDCNGRIISLNPAVRRVLGLTEDALDYNLDYKEVANRWMLDPDGAPPDSDRPVLDTLSSGIPYNGAVYSLSLIHI